jgi:ketosteroid isomerase-like protein
MVRISAAIIGVLMLLLPGVATADKSDDEKAVAALDTEYQLAVKNNDAETMDRILHDEFVLVLGTGQVATKEDLLKNARDKTYVYELQDEAAGTQKVRVWGDTAVVTAKLLLKFTKDGKTVDRKYGSATPTCARLRAGNTFSAKHRLHCRKVRSSKTFGEDGEIAGAKLRQHFVIVEHVVAQR